MFCLRLDFFVIAARSVLVLPKKLKGLVIGSCLAGVIVFHALHLGQAHTHFHWLAGGPTNGWRHLSLSNVDWGQSTYRMADWARAHPEKRPLTVMFVSGRGNPSLLVKDLESIQARNGKRQTLMNSPWFRNRVGICCRRIS